MISMLSADIDWQASVAEDADYGGRCLDLDLSMHHTARQFPAVTDLLTSGSVRSRLRQRSFASAVHSRSDISFAVPPACDQRQLCYRKLFSLSLTLLDCKLATHRRAALYPVNSDDRRGCTNLSPSADTRTSEPVRLFECLQVAEQITSTRRPKTYVKALKAADSAKFS